ncbi:hypothetical protein GGI25_004381 [Coemansia spiralis]|uniref:Cytochrome P450 n=2 Tax=Coemansia TaxID=4863 RepID=A0A9W8G685_9FUNG|nr:hypothetical protein EDC05_000885 [Coemansia umbellata]KAJ2624840.1 hypothetical protein GGI26_001256 [Coemansia sp. RSA 1358]KAJ2674360.1 hypothetical protein GGI25_004381 [Coemansia spiralis]
MNGAGGNSTRLMFDDDDNESNGTLVSSIMCSLAALALILAVFKVIYERWITPLSKVPGRFLHSVSSIPMRYHMLNGTLPEFLHSLHARYGAVVRISPQRVSVADPQMVRHVLGSHTFGKTPSYDNPLEPTTFSTRSPELSTLRRRQLGTGFGHRHLLEMEAKIFECAVTNVMGRLDGLDTVQYHRLFSLATLDTIGAVGFGQSFGALSRGDHELVQLLNRIRVFNYITMALPWLKKLTLLGSPRTLTRLIGYAERAMAARRQGKPQPDLLQLMLDSTMRDQEIVPETILHLIAGVDTTTAGLTWTLTLLLRHPEIHRQLCAELRKWPEPLSFDVCRRIPLLGAVIAESLRLLSPAPGMLPRLAPEGTRLGGYYLPQGTWVCCSLGAVHWSPAVFHDPLRFDPQRFMGEGAELNRQNMLAFSTGVRACLGRNLAVVEMHLVLGNILRRFDFALPQGAKGGALDVPRATRMTMNPTRPDRDCVAVVSRAKA